MEDSPWSYDPPREIKNIIRLNKKFLAFTHEPRPHVEYFVNQFEQEFEASLEWEIRALNKAWLTLKSIKKYRNWEVRQ